jgi:hypothetical protein
MLGATRPKALKPLVLIDYPVHSSAGLIGYPVYSSARREYQFFEASNLLFFEAVKMASNRPHPF